jgi:thiol-disulfide isomerase/thioredoxin
VTRHVCQHSGRTVAGLIAIVLTALVAAGCGGSSLKPIQTETEFQEQVILAKQPVIVDFYKGGCPTCLALDPMLDKLMADYGDRVFFARFEIMKPWFAVTSDTLKKEHRIAYYPTVILFVAGQEKKRWVLNFDSQEYRTVLEEIVGPPTSKEPKPAVGNVPERLALAPGGA